MRNVRDWAKKKRKELIIAANDKTLDPGQSSLILFTDSFVSLLSNEAIYPESETSVDEFALNVDTFSNSNYRIMIRAQMNLPLKISSNRQSKKASQVRKRLNKRLEASQVIYKEPRL